ncbi:hypothetical protein HZA99_01405 [Candidatus Woesearchaeota archaeon]|nr:hypothetical protein [Candidatus Woesearchaeota archaeon]
MEAQILFLGTAGDSFVLSKQERTAGGFVIQTPQSQILVNPGPGAFVNVARTNINIAKTTAIIVTDNTLLHAHDTNAIIDILTLGSFDQKGILLAAKSALQQAEESQQIENKENFPLIAVKYQNAVEKTIVLQENTKVACNDVQIETVKIKNKDPDAVGVKIITTSFSLGYSNKTKYLAKLKDAFQDVEILILELPLKTANPKEEGLCLEEVEKLIEEIKPQLTVLTGFGISIIKEDILEITRSINRKTNCQIIAAKDGFSFDPTSYAVQLRQKRLNGF